MRPEKTTIVDDLSARLNASPFLIVTEYAGMNVIAILRTPTPAGWCRRRMQSGEKHLFAKSGSGSGFPRSR